MVLPKRANPDVIISVNPKLKSLGRRSVNNASQICVIHGNMTMRVGPGRVSPKRINFCLATDGSLLHGEKWSGRANSTLDRELDLGLVARDKGNQ